MDSALACRLQSPDCLRTFRSLWGEPFDSFLFTSFSLLILDSGLKSF